MPADTGRRRRGRPSRLDRSSAADIAMVLFWERGYDGVGVAELSQALEVTPPSIYSTFGNKRGLYEAAVDRYESTQGSFLETAVAASDSAQSLLHNVLVAAARSYTRSSCPAGCLVLDGARNSASAEAREINAGRREGALRYLTSAFAEYERVRAPALARYTLCAMTGLSGSARTGETRRTLVRIATEFARSPLVPSP